MELSQRLVDLVEGNSERLTRRVIHDLKTHPGTKKYRDYDDDQLYRRTFQVYRNFGKFMSTGTTVDDIRRDYIVLGKQRRREGFAISEVVQALVIIRRHIWLLVESEGFLDSAFDLRIAIDLINRTVVFFDRAIYYTIVGFESKN